MAQADKSSQRPAPAPTCPQAEPPPFPKIPGLAISWDVRRGFWLICGHTTNLEAQKGRSDCSKFLGGWADGCAPEIHSGGIDLGFVNEFFDGKLGKIHSFNAYNFTF